MNEPEIEATLQSVRLPDMVSYAQHDEDVMLRRALYGVEQGTYVDIGAAWPVEDSVTKHFYDQGWTGVNVEPNPTLFGELELQRPLDVNLHAAVAAQAGKQRLALVEGTGLSTLDLDRIRGEAADQHSVIEIEVQTIPLAAIFAEHVGDRDVHFLKVDVEGLEDEVLASNDWDKFRPWIVIAEVGDTRFSPDPKPWEAHLESQGYVRAYDDGLNRWFVDEAAHPELRARLRVGPNPWDHFRTIRDIELEGAALRCVIRERELEEAFKDLNALRAEMETLRAANRTLEANAHALQSEFDSARASWAAEQELSRLRAGEILHLQSQVSLLRSRYQTVEAERDQVRSALEGMQQHAAVLQSSRSWRATRPLRVAESLRQAPGPGLRYIGFKALGGKLGSDKWIARPLGGPNQSATPSVTLSQEEVSASGLIGDTSTPSGPSNA